MLKLLKHFTIFSLLAQSCIYAVWQDPVVVSNPAIPTAGVSTCVLKVTPQGNAISVWLNDTSFTFPGDTNVASSYYDRASNTWTPAEIISSLALNSANKPKYTAQGDPDIAINSTGYAVAVWEGEFSEEPNFPSVVFATTRSSSGVWDPNITILSDQSGDFFSDQVNVALNEAGTALSTWRQNDNDTGDDRIAFSFLPFGGSWTTPVFSPPFPGTGGQGKPYPFLNPSGNGVVSWKGRVTQGPVYSIQAATYDVGTNLFTTVTLDTAVGTNNLSEDPRCAMDANGNAVVIWQNTQMVKTSYFNGTSWEAPIVLGPCRIFLDFNSPAVVMDLNGNITATWTASDDSIKSSSRPFGGTWSTPVTLSEPGDEGGFNVFQSTETLSVNTEGDVIAIWLAFATADPGLTSGRLGQPLPLDTIFSNYKPFSLEWRPQELVDQPTDGVIMNSLNIGLASCGFAVAMWQSDDTNLVYAAINENLILVQDPTVVRCCTQFATQKRCVNVLTWAPDDCVFSFNIYCNGILIANVINTGGSLQFVDSNSCRNCEYTISAVNFFGAEGDQVPFVFL